ncbi:ABC-type transporter, periplasmic subunit family 3 [Clostridium sp. DL-VIII]|uniref:ABC transporter substrate-binding protein n=1 Tax=Clostridium sp. DL-VIII TaxID=641107 RepID=UPI00023B01BE|nr:ABC transporter substrate-binding protein [Clostridium sp. DL-VIII]EHJ00523.1 ABC-type transporter, periplasmic subunit family 3 [Clostridium sp. DL-VIII]
MKRIFALIVIISFIGMIIEYGSGINDSITANNSIEQDRLQTIQKKGILTVASANEIPFFHENSQADSFVGIDADIITEIARRLGINKIEMKEVSFANLFSELNTDSSVDMAANGIYITPEREKIVAFTEPLYKESEVVIVPKASKINFKDDLKNAMVGVERGTAFENLAQNWKKSNLVKDVVTFGNIPDLLAAINSGKVDAGVADSVVINYFLKKETNLFLRTFKDYTPELQGIIGIAVRKNDIALLNALNEKITDMKTDGTLYSILVGNGLDGNNVVNIK